MTKLTKGTKFIVCGHEELKNLGWNFDPGGGGESYYRHHNFPGNSITHGMIEKYQGKTLTIVKGWVQEGWYIVEDNGWAWPAATFLMLPPTLDHTCEEGITPIDGWFICKQCGTNLRIIK